jgi:hypothetical protein
MMARYLRTGTGTVFLLSFAFMSAHPGNAQTSRLDLPDSELVAAYNQAVTKNVLAALNPKIFFGYWSVCADGKGFGYGNTYPSLDGHQLTDALLYIDEVKVVQANWDYVRSFQRQDGLLPLAIIPSSAGKMIGPEGTQALVSPNGGLYKHWVPGNPLEALASITYIQNADVIYRHTLDRQWLSSQLASINLAADYLDSLTTSQGSVRGGGFYVERPARIESDGVTQCYAIDALRRVAALNLIAGSESKSLRYDRLANRIQHNFITRFWIKDHFAEYLHPQRGLIANHGLTVVDWAAIATGIATPEQQAILWKQLKNEERFHYGGMPTGISTSPETYEAWEFTYPDRYDLSAMGRVWYLEAWARARTGDAQGLLQGLRKVSQVGRENGYSWHERYQPDAKGGVIAAGPDTYCEYPANLIRIVQRFLLGVEMQLDSSLVLSPVVTEDFWQKGFGQTLTFRGQNLSYRMLKNRVDGTYRGSAPLRLGIRLPVVRDAGKIFALVNDSEVAVRQQGELVFVTLLVKNSTETTQFQIVRTTKGER